MFPPAKRRKTTTRRIMEFIDLPPYFVTSFILPHVIAMFGKFTSKGRIHTSFALRNPMFEFESVKFPSGLSDWIHQRGYKLKPMNNEFVLWGRFKNDVTRKTHFIFRSLFIDKSNRLLLPTDMPFIRARQVVFFGVETLTPLLKRLPDMSNLVCIYLPGIPEVVDYVDANASWQKVPNLHLQGTFRPAPAPTLSVTKWIGKKLHLHNTPMSAVAPWFKDDSVNENLVDLSVSHPMDFPMPSCPNLKRFSCSFSATGWLEFAVGVSSHLTHLTLESDSRDETITDPWDFSELRYLHMNFRPRNLNRLFLMMQSSEFPELTHLKVEQTAMEKVITPTLWAELPKLVSLTTILMAHVKEIIELVERYSIGLTHLTVNIGRLSNAYIYEISSWSLPNIEHLTLNFGYYANVKFSPTAFNAEGVREIELNGIDSLGGAFETPRRYPNLLVLLNLGSGRGRGPQGVTTILCNNIQVLESKSNDFITVVSDYVHLRIMRVTNAIPPKLVHKLSNELLHSISRDFSSYGFSPIRVIMETFMDGPLHSTLDLHIADMGGMIPLLDPTDRLPHLLELELRVASRDFHMRREDTEKAFGFVGDGVYFGASMAAIKWFKKNYPELAKPVMLLTVANITAI